MDLSPEEARVWMYITEYLNIARTASLNVNEYQSLDGLHDLSYTSVKEYFDTCGADKSERWPIVAPRMDREDCSGVFFAHAPAWILQSDNRVNDTTRCDIFAFRGARFTSSSTTKYYGDSLPRSLQTPDFSAIMGDCLPQFSFVDSEVKGGFFCTRQDLSEMLKVITGISKSGAFPKGIEATSGPLWRYCTVRDTLLKQYYNHGDPTNRPLIICGHSFGGQLAQICALDILHFFPNAQIHLYPVGSPMVGNDEFAQVLEGNSSIITRRLANAQLLEVAALQDVITARPAFGALIREADCEDWDRFKSICQKALSGPSEHYVKPISRLRNCSLVPWITASWIPTFKPHQLEVYWQACAVRACGRGLSGSFNQVQSTFWRAWDKTAMTAVANDDGSECCVVHVGINTTRMWLALCTSKYTNVLLDVTSVVDTQTDTNAGPAVIYANGFYWLFFGRPDTHQLWYGAIGIKDGNFNWRTKPEKFPGTPDNLLEVSTPEITAQVFQGHVWIWCRTSGGHMKQINSGLRINPNRMYDPTDPNSFIFRDAIMCNIGSSGSTWTTDSFSPATAVNASRNVLAVCHRGTRPDSGNVYGASYGLGDSDRMMTANLAIDGIYPNIKKLSGIETQSRPSVAFYGTKLIMVFQGSDVPQNLYWGTAEFDSDDNSRSIFEGWKTEFRFSEGGGPGQNAPGALVTLRGGVYYFARSDKAKGEVKIWRLS